MHPDDKANLEVEIGKLTDRVLERSLELGGPYGLFLLHQKLRRWTIAFDAETPPLEPIAEELSRFAPEVREDWIMFVYSFRRVIRHLRVSLVPFVEEEEARRLPF